jgi:predicted nucleotide-binding protein (sugar kinase/HSP70/actin superfamily)
VQVNSSVNISQQHNDFKKAAFGLHSLYRTLRLAESKMLKAAEMTTAGDRTVVIIGEAHLQYASINTELSRLIASRGFSILGLENFCATPQQQHRVLIRTQSVVSGFLVKEPVLDALRSSRSLFFNDSSIKAIGLESDSNITDSAILSNFLLEKLQLLFRHLIANQSCILVTMDAEGNVPAIVAQAKEAEKYLSANFDFNSINWEETPLSLGGNKLFGVSMKTLMSHMQYVSAWIKQNVIKNRNEAAAEIIDHNLDKGKRAAVVIGHSHLIPSFNNNGDFSLAECLNHRGISTITMLPVSLLTDLKKKFERN